MTSETDFENEELRVQVNTLRYELDNLKQERDLTELRHEKELRDLQLRADSDFRKAQVRIILSDTFLCDLICILTNSGRRSRQ